MSLYSNQHFIIKNSKGESFVFYALEDNQIELSIYDEKNIITDSNPFVKEQVIDFSADIDQDDNIHLLVLTKVGSLKYYVFTNRKWSVKVLTSLDMRSNNYKYLTLRSVYGRIDIFISFCNLLTPEVWTIQHISFDKKRWQKTNIISITPGKYMSPFLVDYDTLGNIHLLYKDNSESGQQIYHTSYSIFTKKWNRVPKKISDTNSDNLYPYMLIDSRNTVHVIWSTLNNNRFQLIYKQRPSIGEKKYKWIKYDLPIVSGSNTVPIIFEEKNILNLIFRSNDELKSMFSKNHGINWNLNSSLEPVPLGDSVFIKYSTNNALELSHLRINHSFGHIDDSLQIYLSKAYVVEQKTIKGFEDQVECNTVNLIDEEDDLIEDSTKNSSEESLEDKDQSMFRDVNHKNIANQISPLEQNTAFEELSEYGSFNLYDKVDYFNNDSMKNFIIKTKESLDAVLTDCEKINRTKEDIEKIIFENTKILEENIILKTPEISEIINQLTAIQSLIQQYKTENQESLLLLESIKEKYQQNRNKIIKIEQDISQTQSQIESLKSPKLLNKLLNIFK